MTEVAVWAVVPVKPLHRAKCRLGAILSEPERAAFALAMLDDVLTAIAATPGLQGFLVVSDDPQVRRLAQGRGGHLLSEPQPGGLSAAVTAAARTLAAEPARAMLFLPGDVPLVTGSEIERLLETRKTSPSVTVVPSLDGRGTNGMLCVPSDAMAFHFGADSAQRHLTAARQRAIDPSLLPFAGLARDIDDPDDLVAFADQASATHAQACLERLGIVKRLARQRDAVLDKRLASVPL